MHEVVDDDLSAVCMGAQPRGLDHGLAEIVAVLGRRVTEAHADTHSELLLCAAIARLEGLLHCDRARYRLGGAREHHHEPVAQILDLPSARALERPTKQCEVLLAQLL